uniref:Uncharacterized protein n=1 Tax=Rhizophora mucronata TaxID=61149 RepID=A0A2P2PFP0_RHIMU
MESYQNYWQSLELPQNRHKHVFRSYPI